jgi:hypothetical protein
VWALVGVVAVEFAAVVAATLVLVVDLVTTASASLATAIALTVLTALAAVVLGAILVGVWRGRAWVRAAGVVLQVLLFAVGVGALQGAFANPAWGWPLVGVGALGFVLFVVRPTAGWLSGRDEGA